MTVMHRVISKLLIAPLACATVSCVGVKPVVVDRHAQLENQILGQLRHLESELVLASSVRGQNDIFGQSPLRREAAEAAMRRAFNADDIQRFKQQQVLGEDREGRLTLLARPKTARESRWLRELVSQENHDRAVLMRRVVQLDPELSGQDLPLVRHVFRRLIVHTARPGERIQQPDGRWVTVNKRSSPHDAGSDPTDPNEAAGRPAR